MPPIEPLPLLSYVVVSTFTPGPANISSSSLGVLYGFRRTTKYQVGLAAGVFLMMLAGGLVSASMMNWFSAIEPALRFIGAAYILYLAYGILRASYTIVERETRPLGFGHGLKLQLSNPKLVVYALTLFSTFLTSIAASVTGLVLAAFLLAAVSICATSVWTMFGTGIKNRLRNPSFRRLVNICFALFLVYAAFDLAGLFPTVK